MKQTYISPLMCAMQTQHEMPIAVSGVNSTNGIGYGGVDQNGTVEPDVKGNPFGDSLFDE